MEQRLEFVNKNYLKLAEHIWVGNEDPGCIIYDPQAKPYILRDGWSNKQVGEILSEWLFIMSGEKINASVKSEN